LRCLASGPGSHAEGQDTTASGTNSHAENTSTASGDWSHSEGYATVASGDYSHAAGNNATAGPAQNTYCWSDGAAFQNNTQGRYAIRAGGEVYIDNGSTTDMLTATHNNTTTWTYNANNGAHWATAAPTTISDAIDRLAAAFFGQHGAVP